MTDGDIIIALQDKSSKYVYGKYNIIPEGILVHSTAAPNPYLKRYVEAPDILGVNPNKNWFGGPNSNDVIPHGAIGLDENGDIRIAQILPYDKACQCAGPGRKGSYNVYNSNRGYIQFEIAEDDLTDINYFNLAMRAAIEYCAYLIQRYPTIKLENVVSHKEANARGYASGHVDPEHWMSKFNKNMDWFREQVQKKLVVPAQPMYRVQCGAFRQRANAEALLADLKSKGYQAFIVESKE